GGSRHRARQRTMSCDQTGGTQSPPSQNRRQSGPTRISTGGRTAGHHHRRQYCRESRPAAVLPRHSTGGRTAGHPHRRQNRRAREAPPPSQEAGPGGDASRPVSRVLSPPPVRPPRGPPPAVGDGHPSGAPVARRLERPHPGSGTSSPWSAEALRPCSALLRAGFTWPAGHPAAGGLLPHHFTVAAARLRAPWLCPFCGTLLRVTPTGRYPAPCSAEPGLSSSGRAARDRPAGLRRRVYPWARPHSCARTTTRTYVRVDGWGMRC
ncbi:MAG: hypothetical protein QOE72_3025, partial [Chloroflexota bacterium]|nr:hypothetical protein [Chloroflexota bacterium]